MHALKISLNTILFQMTASGSHVYNNPFQGEIDVPVRTYYVYYTLYSIIVFKCCGAAFFGWSMSQPENPISSLAPASFRITTFFHEKILRLLKRVDT